MKKEIKIGVIMVLTLGTLIWGVNYLKGKNFFSKSQYYFVIYDDVSGLLESNGVFIKGYKVGHVSSISFSDSSLSKLKVILAIHKDVNIPVGTRASIYNLDLIGNKAVELIFSKNTQFYNEGDTIIGDVEITFTKQLEPYKVQAYKLLVSIDSLSNAMLKIFDPTTRERLRDVIKNVKYTTDALAIGSEGITGTLNNFNTLSQNLIDNNKKLNQILSKLNTFSDTLTNLQFQKSMNKIDVLLDDSHSLLEKLHDEKGTLGKLINNDSIYQNLNKTTADLDSLINEVRSNPKRFLNFSVFGNK